MKTFVVGGDNSYTSFISDCEIVSKISDANVIVFTGGEDVSPSYYNGTKSIYTKSNINRDRKEKAIFSKIPKDKLCIGIGRGAQFLSVMYGAKLIQHVRGHDNDSHIISAVDGNVQFYINSYHHQLIDLNSLNSKIYRLLYYSTCVKQILDFPDDIGFNGIYLEPEVILFNDNIHPKCLCIQGHPEKIPNTQVAKMLDSTIHSLL